MANTIKKPKKKSATKKKRKINSTPAQLANLRGHRNLNGLYNPQTESEYKPEYCQAILDYFSKDKEKIEEVKVEGQILYKQGFKLPTVAGFADSIGYCKETIYYWAEKNPEFAKALRRAVSIQENSLVQRTLAKSYPEKFAAFLACNYSKMANKTVLGGDEEKPIKLEVSGSDSLLEKLGELLKK